MPLAIYSILVMTTEGWLQIRENIKNKHLIGLCFPLWERDKDEYESRYFSQDMRYDTFARLTEEVR